MDAVQTEILRLDQDWAAEREQYLIRQNGNYGPPFVPTLLNSILPALALAGIAVFLIVQGAAGNSSQRYIVLLGLVFLGLSLFYFLFVSQRAKAYNAAYARYQQRRSGLAEQLKRPDNI